MRSEGFSGVFRQWYVLGAFVDCHLVVASRIRHLLIRLCPCGGGMDGWGESGGSDIWEGGYISIWSFWAQFLVGGGWPGGIPGDCEGEFVRGIAYRYGCERRKVL